MHACCRVFRLVWAVVGDLEKIEAGIRELNLGRVQVISVEGEPVVGTS